MIRGFLLHSTQILQLMETPAPFSLSVFGEMVYWSDTQSRTIQRAHKVTGKQHQVLLRRPGQHLHIKGSTAFLPIIRSGMAFIGVGTQSRL